jgi:peptide/nickel transport system substrate-binding protein
MGEGLTVRLLLGLLAFSLAAACAPPLERAQPPAGASDQARRPKTLTVGVQREPNDLGSGFNQGTTSTAGGAGSVKVMAHDRLAVEMELDRWQPQLAMELPSIERGTWRIQQDGTMETVWRLHDNIRWHDGTPFSADDLTISLAVFGRMHLLDL